MAARKDMPPPRPPAPKLSLNKSRQHSTGSIAIRFNASSIGDDIDEDDLGLNSHLQFEVKKDAAPDDPNGHTSQSAPVSEVTTPVGGILDLKENRKDEERASSLSPVSGEQVSLGANTTPSDNKRKYLANFKEKFQQYQDKIPEPLTAFIEKKMEAYAGATSPTGGNNSNSGYDKETKATPAKQDDKATVKEMKEKEPRKHNLSGTEIEIGQDPLSALANSRDSLSSSASLQSFKEEDCDVFLETEGTEENEDLSNGTTQDIAVVDEHYYGDETFEDLSPDLAKARANAIMTASRPQHLAGVTPKTKPTSKNVSKTNKSKPGDPGIAVSLSGLLSSSGSTPDVEEELIKESNIASTKDSQQNKNNDSNEMKNLSDDSGTNIDFTSQIGDTSLAPTESKESRENSVLSFIHSISLLVAFLAYCFLPVPNLLVGFLFGVLSCYWTLQWWDYFTTPKSPKPPFEVPDLDTLPPLRVPEMKQPKIEDGKFKTWMNELKRYQPDDYHINQTFSVFVTLEGTHLRLQRPKTKIPKRAMWDEPHHTAHFIHQRFFDLSGSKVFLMPEGLVKKRLWSKKYPLCISLAKQGRKMEKHQSPSVPESLSDSADSKHSTSPTTNTNVICDDSVLYLFARTGRDKETWYRRFVAATHGNPIPTRIDTLLCSPTEVRRRRLKTSRSADGVALPPKNGTHGADFVPAMGQASSSEYLNEADSGGLHKSQIENETPEETLKSYMRYMSKVMPQESLDRMVKNSKLAKEPNFSPFASIPISCDPQMHWTNALLSRCLWDFLREPFWADKMKEKIQKKLSKIHVPYFIDDLIVTAIDLGNELPIIRRASKPYLDEMGFWIDLDIAYNGGLCMVLETKVNLMKLKQKGSTHHLTEHTKVGETKSPVHDSEEEDSAESSTDEEAEEATPEKYDSEESNNTSGSTGKKILRFVDKIAASKYFQQATENKYIKKAMEGVSNTRLVLAVELKSCIGTLAVNIPPPPSDRIWYGFRTNPKLWLSAKPQVGERLVTVSHVTEWIENKLSIEFQRVLVMPNMDDIHIPVMFPHLEKNPFEMTDEV